MYLTEEKSYVMAPTHEEEVTRLVSHHVENSRQLPLLLYQHGVKFRKEKRAKGGLLRLREFIMKDLYAFDESLENAKITYGKVCDAYKRIFQEIGLDVLQVEASCGDMGGHMSHEYHLRSDVGEDALFLCVSCSRAFNRELFLGDVDVCPHCASKKFESTKGIELGHTFLLGNCYSQVFGAAIKNAQGAKIPLEMGCFGIGISRLVAAIAESEHDEYGLRWPSAVAPYKILVTGGQDMAKDLAELELLYHKLDRLHPGKVLLDDRNHLGISWRLKDAHLLGIPSIVVMGKRHVSDGLFEVYHHRRHGEKPVPLFLPEPSLLDLLR
jgi:prolyl-tRNA synthetase